MASASPAATTDPTAGTMEKKAVETVEITINGTPLTVPKGEYVVEVAKRLGIEIPVFCHHPRLKPVGMCRMCLVEVGMPGPDGAIRKMPKPQASCTLPVAQGMSVETDTPGIHKDRKGILEFLLINHPLDCPICDRGGECPLQNTTLFYGPSTSRFVEMKRHNKKAYPLSEHVELDLERCIQCGRCVRFTEEISGDSQLAFRFRGGAMQPATFELTNFDSKFSGNTIEICPVGALTNRHYRFRARPWDLQTSEAICTVCSNGCAVWFDHRVGKYMRTNGRTNELVNEEWTCDRGKFGHEFYNDPNRTETTFVRQGDALIAGDWANAYSQILPRFIEGGDSVAFLAGRTLSNESLHGLARFASEFALTSNLDWRMERRLDSALVPQVQTPITSLEDQKALFVLGAPLADEEPIVFLRVRKAWYKGGTQVVMAHSAATDVDSFATSLLHYREGTAHHLLDALHALAADESADILAACEETGLREDAVRAAARLVRGATILTTVGFGDEGPEAVGALDRLVKSGENSLNVYARGTNEFGASRILPNPDAPPARNTREILEACVEGKISSLWLAGLDLLAEYPDRGLAERALENVEFLVVQDLRRTPTSDYASVVLPMTAPAEEGGTFTNMDGRVQRLDKILQPLGHAKPVWRVMTEMSQRLRPGRPFITPEDVYEDLAKRVGFFAPSA